MAPFLVVTACSKQSGRSEPVEPTTPVGKPATSCVKNVIKGVPAGHEPSELTDLRVGKWRFFSLYDCAESSSVLESYLALRGTRPMRGVAGLASLIRDLDLVASPGTIPPEKLARQVGVFFIEATSRSSHRYKVLSSPEKDLDLEKLTARFGELAYLKKNIHPPSMTRQPGGFVLKAWIEQDTGLHQWWVEVGSDGKTHVFMADPATGKRDEIK